MPLLWFIGVAGYTALVGGGAWLANDALESSGIKKPGQFAPGKAFNIAAFGGLVGLAAGGYIAYRTLK